MCTFRQNLDPKPGVFAILQRLEWWLHLFKEDPHNWRLKSFGKKLLVELKDAELNALVDVFKEVVEYNQEFLHSRPEVTKK